MRTKRRKSKRKIKNAAKTFGSIENEFVISIVSCIFFIVDVPTYDSNTLHERCQWVVCKASAGLFGFVFNKPTTSNEHYFLSLLFHLHFL